MVTPDGNWQTAANDRLRLFARPRRMRSPSSAKSHKVLINASFIRTKQAYTRAVMHIQVVTFKLNGMTEAEYLRACEEQFAPLFRDLPGLISKVWLRNSATNTYGGVYTWKDRASMSAYVDSDLFRSMRNHPQLMELTSQDYAVLDGISSGPIYPAPFGFATVADDLQVAKEFYGRFYPYDVVEGVFGGIRYFSIMKDGVTLVNVFEKSEKNPLRGTLPILKVDSVRQSVTLLKAIGGSLVMSEAICPCTSASFAVCADPGGNQFMFKEPSR
jgi:predicted enzyme related to lactoylglutathione lyase